MIYYIYRLLRNAFAVCGSRPEQSGVCLGRVAIATRIFLRVRNAFRRSILYLGGQEREFSLQKRSRHGPLQEQATRKPARLTILW
jgi:hypothetical protein